MLLLLTRLPCHGPVWSSLGIIIWSISNKMGSLCGGFTAGLVCLEAADTDTVMIMWRGDHYNAGRGRQTVHNSLHFSAKLSGLNGLEQEIDN